MEDTQQENGYYQADGIKKNRDSQNKEGDREISSDTNFGVVGLPLEVLYL